MSATSDPSAAVYHCLVCGPVLRLPYGDEGHVTIHNNVPHPHEFTFNEEENPQ